jgi:hypothetical protein
LVEPAGELGVAGTDREQLGATLPSGHGEQLADELEVQLGEREQMSGPQQVIDVGVLGEDRPQPPNRFGINPPRHGYSRRREAGPARCRRIGQQRVRGAFASAELQEYVLGRPVAGPSGPEAQLLGRHAVQQHEEALVEPAGSLLAPLPFAHHAGVDTDVDGESIPGECNERLGDLLQRQVEA